VVNAFVGAMVGMERAILPPIAEQYYALAAKTAVLSFIVVFGITKAVTNYAAGRLSDRFGRKHVLVAGWMIAAPVPFVLIWAPSWNWVLVANALLGVSQGLTWLCARRLVDGVALQLGDGHRGGGGSAREVMAIATRARQTPV